MLIRRDDSLLLVVDLQQKLAPAIFEGEQAIANSVRLLNGARQLGVPGFVSEQYVRGLGPSVDAIRDAATAQITANLTVNVRFFEKTHFSCAAEPGVTELLRSTHRSQVILTGTLNGLAGVSRVLEVSDSCVRLLSEHTVCLPEPWFDMVSIRPLRCANN